jgi:hypothetical protein
MNRLLTTVVRGALAALLALAAAVSSGADIVAGAMERQGTIDSLDFETNTAVIGGTRYSVAIDAVVEIGGSYGAFTMLTPGMNVAFTFDLYSDKTRVLTELKELPAGTLPIEY